MNRELYKRHISGVANDDIRPYETVHKEISRRAAADGMVLLKNENNLLPLEKGTRVALYGAGAIRMIKGGTGSGDVNARECVGIREGLKNAGLIITNNRWLNKFEKLYAAERLKWRDELLRRSHEPGGNLFGLYAGNPMPVPHAEEPKAEENTDTAIYVLSRVAGEGADRRDEEGDFRLDAEERNFLSKLNKLYKHIILVLNTGGLMDLDFTDELNAIESILYMMQPGMEGGNALGDIITGRVVPSGKLTDTWAYHYSDYPSTATFSMNDATSEFEEYHEGIYVGYRYFDTFGVSVRYGFGFGLSYTTFGIEMLETSLAEKKNDVPRIRVRVRVTNTGDTYMGREVVQVYASCPDGKLQKEFRRLVGFAKTQLLGPGMCETLEISFPIYSLTSYDESVPGYVLENGYYGIWVGNSLGDSKPYSMLKLERSAVINRTEHVCELKDDFPELECPESKRTSKYHAWVKWCKNAGIPIINIGKELPETVAFSYGVRSKRVEPEAMAFVETLSEDQLIRLSTGDPGRAENNGMNFVGSGGVSVPGSAAETSRCALDLGLGSLVLTDGPAGLRLDKGYYVTKDGEVERRGFMDTIEDGIFSEKERHISDTDKLYHQYCTAFPVGNLLAQTWDTALIEEIGQAVGEEMLEFQTSLWLAPGMNIHRNPLCGRNFEYYSEDPLVSGIIAAAMTRGVQSVGGCGTTIKHFACNNQEENRNHCDSRVHERALREIYLKGFEICVRSSQPMAIMTSYNLINGIHAANSYDLCSTMARDEWGFAGLIMTDWCTTEQGPDCTAAGCLRAGNDLVCPGCDNDHDNIREELADGRLSIDELKLCIARLVRTVWQSNAYADAPAYNDRFSGLYRFMTVKKCQ